MNYLEMVKEFHETLMLPVRKTPGKIDKKAFSKRVMLICEELSEYCKAVSTQNLPEIADAIGDLLYVVFGTAVEHGLPMNEIFRQIHKSNMTKKDGHIDKSGKLIKPKNYIPVNLSWLNNKNKSKTQPKQ